jgi:hypothetical protein
MSSSASCCINGAFYSCPSMAAANTCFQNLDASQCARDFGRDAECAN